MGLHNAARDVQAQAQSTPVVLADLPKLLDHGFYGKFILYWAGSINQGICRRGVRDNKTARFSQSVTNFSEFRFDVARFVEVTGSFKTQELASMEY